MSKPTFLDFVTAASDDNLALKPEGVEDLFSLFEHIAEGGTVSDFKLHDYGINEILALLACAWTTSRTVSLNIEEFIDDDEDY